MNSSLKFEVLFDDEVVSYCGDDLPLVGNEHLLSLANDYSDGSWHYERFNRFIWDNVAETALTYRERESCLSSPMTILSRAADRLRICDDSGKGSELAEIFLYGIMRHYYGALSAVPKIFYKQNRNDNAKGADSVHLVVTGDKSFELWLGEAKFYKKINMGNVEGFIASVGNTLERIAIEKERSIILGISDVEDSIRAEYPDNAEDLIGAIRSTLSLESSIDEIKRILHIPILLIDECNITKKARLLDGKYRDAVREFHKNRAKKFFARQVELLKGKVNLYSDIDFHLILFPIPDKDKVVGDFLAKARCLRSASKDD